jgi:DNA-binding XRE family transcriptional regulator
METPLRHLREKSGLTAVELAIELRTSTQHVYALEAGSRNMQTKTAVKLARILAKRLKVKPSKVLAELTQVDSKENAAAVTAA